MSTPVVTELQFGLRVATTTIAGAVLLTASLPRKLDVHDPVLPQVVAYGVLLALLAVEVVLLLTRRDWGRFRLPALAVTLGASILSTWTLRPDLLTTSTDWSFGSTGWLAVVLLLARPLSHLAAFLAVHELVTVARVATLPVDADFVLNLVAGSIGTIGFPFACGIVSTTMRKVAQQAERAAAEMAAIRAEEGVADGRFEARRTRLGELDVTTEPLLRGLADARLSPDDPGVQRACAVEAARVRRMLAENDLVDDPLIHELQHGADVAGRRDVLIDLQVAGAWPTPGRDVRRALLDGPLAVLSTARAQAWVSVLGTPEALSVNVVADGGGWDITPPTHDDVAHTVVDGGDRFWIEARWTHASLSS